MYKKVGYYNNYLLLLFPSLLLYHYLQYENTLHGHVISYGSATCLGCFEPVPIGVGRGLDIRAS